MGSLTLSIPHLIWTSNTARSQKKTDQSYVLWSSENHRDRRRAFLTRSGSDTVSSPQDWSHTRSMGRGNLKDKRTHGTEHANGRSWTLPLLQRSSPCTYFHRHQETGFRFKGAASNHPQPQRCAPTRVHETPGEVSTAHLR